MKEYKALTFEVDLSGLGKEQWIQEELDYDTIAQKIIDTLIDVMREKDVEASSNLIQSLEPESKNGEIVIYADYYWKFIDKGVNGLLQNRNSPYSFKFVPASKKHALSIAKWLEFRGLATEFTTLADAYRVATATKIKGIRGRKFVEEFEKELDNIEII
jgi:hypothetical protein